MIKEVHYLYISRLYTWKCALHYHKIFNQRKRFFFYILMDLLGFDIVKEFLLGGESFRTQDAKEIEKCHNFVYK